jgi:glyoxylase-like metal-dependent hydrolase (beta-lactamase superfamily II)
MSGRALPFIGSGDAWTGGAVTAATECVLAPNASPWTLDGTNTWIVGPDSGSTCVVIDPGPDDPAHLDAVIARAEARGQRITAIALTHGHVDHSEGARSLAARTGAPVRAVDARFRSGSAGLIEADVIDVDGWPLRVIITPGHSSDSVCFVNEIDSVLLTGDTILGRGTTLVAYPDGNLGEYLGSLDDLRRVVEEHSLATLLPGHGPVLDRPGDVLDAYRRHRMVRLSQVRDAMAQGVLETEAIVDLVYEGSAPEVRPAAVLTVQAQVEYLLSERDDPDARYRG